MDQVIVLRLPFQDLRSLFIQQGHQAHARFRFSLVCACVHIEKDFLLYQVQQIGSDPYFGTSEQVDPDDKLSATVECLEYETSQPL